MPPVSNVFQICRHLHIQRSRACGDQSQCGQRMRGSVGPLPVVSSMLMSMLVSGSATRTAERSDVLESRGIIPVSQKNGGDGQMLSPSRVTVVQCR